MSAKWSLDCAILFIVSMSFLCTEFLFQDVELSIRKQNMHRGPLLLLMITLFMENVDLNITNTK